MLGPSTETQAPMPGSAPSPPAPGEANVLTPGDVRKVLVKRKWLILLGILAGLIAGGVYILTAVPEYEAVARVDIDPGRSTNIGINDLIEQKLTGESATSERIETEIRIMQSDTVSMAVIKSLNLYEKKPFSTVFKKHPYNGSLTPLQRYSILKAYSQALRIMVVPGTDMVEVHFHNSNPKVASEVANAILDEYMQRDLRARFEGTTRVSNWLSGQLGALKKQVETSQTALAQFQKKNGLVGMDAQGGGGNLVLDSLRTVNQQLAEAEADRIVKQARYKMALTRNPELLVSVAPTTVLASLRQQQGALLVQAAQLQSKYGADWPKVRELRRQLAQVQKDINNEINSLTQRFAEEYNAAVATENLMRKRLEATKQEAYRENESAAQYEILKHGADSASDLYDALQTKLKEAGITAGLNSNNIDVIDRAAIPARPVSPVKREDLAFGLLGGLLLGIALAMFFESLDDTVRTSEDVEAVSGLPSLAVVPHFQQGAKGKETGNAIVSHDLVSYTDPQSVAAESFRTLRSSVLLSAVDRELKLILVTSSFAAEGKSTCVSNLAISFARRAARVLLVDTDLRKGTLHLKFRTSNRAGLSTLLSRESGEEAYEHPLPDLPNLTVVTRGPVAPNPGEMLGSRSMEDMLARWREEYDHVILDTSPVLAVSDTLTLAPMVDAALVLVRSGVTRKKALLRTRDQLLRIHARLLGVVVNDVDLRLENYYLYSKRYDYGYKGGYGSGYGAADEEK